MPIQKTNTLAIYHEKLAQSIPITSYLVFQLNSQLLVSCNNKINKYNPKMDHALATRSQPETRRRYCSKHKIFAAIKSDNHNRKQPINDLLSWQLKFPIKTLPNPYLAWQKFSTEHFSWELVSIYIPLLHQYIFIPT